MSADENQASLPALLMFTADPTDRALDGWCPREWLYTELEDAGLMEGVTCADDVVPALEMAATRRSAP